MNPTPKYLKPLEPYLWPGAPWKGTPLEGLESQFLYVCHGRRGPVVFICTVDRGSQTELSLAQYDPKKRGRSHAKRCTMNQAVAFCKAMGFDPVEVTKGPHTWHAVLVEGVSLDEVPGGDIKVH